MKPERIVLESLLAGIDLEQPGQQRLSSVREMQRTTAEGCSLADGSSDLGATIFFQAVAGIEPDNQTSQFPHITK